MLVRDLARLLLEARYYNKQWLILQKLCVVLLTQAFMYKVEPSEFGCNQRDIKQGVTEECSKV